MPSSREVVVTAALAVSAMIFLFGALTFWILASIARDPQAGGSATLFSIAAVVSAIVGLLLFGLAARRVHDRLSE